MRGMRRHTEGDSLVVLAELIKLWCSVALVAVKDKQPVRPSSVRFCMYVEVLNPLKAKLVGCPSIVTNTDNPVRRDILIPAGLVELSFQDYKGWKTPAGRVNTLSYCHPLSITWINSSCSANSVRAGNNL